MANLWNRTGFSFSRIKMARLSAAKARVSRRAAREERTLWRRFMRGCMAFATFWKELATFVVSVVSVCAIAIIAVLLWKALTQKTITIAPISVPKTLAESGYTADVAAQRLRVKVFEEADPYIAAASLYRHHDPGKSREIASQIIAHRPETDQSVRWAHSLVGLILLDQHKNEEAIAGYAGRRRYVRASNRAPATPQTWS
jgi:hypothetical protein